jgi:hypothetical protein
MHVLKCDQRLQHPEAGHVQYVLGPDLELSHFFSVKYQATSASD